MNNQQYYGNFDTDMKCSNRKMPFIFVYLMQQLPHMQQDSPLGNYAKTGALCHTILTHTQDITESYIN